MSSGPDLFVVCKHCQAEVSPYITECPYCGKRLRKRAQLDRPGRGPGTGRSSPGLHLGRLRPGEIPGIRPDRHPYASGTIVGVSALVTLLPLAGVFVADRAVIAGPLGTDWWRAITANFVYGDLASPFASTSPFASSCYALAALLLVAVFGTALERRHGPLLVVALFLVAGAAGMATVAVIEPAPLAAGGNAGALALLCAWAVPDLLVRRGGGEGEADGLGLLALFSLVMLMPLATELADPLAGVVGGLVGLAAGLGLTRIARAS